MQCLEKCHTNKIYSCILLFAFIQVKGYCIAKHCTNLHEEMLLMLKKFVGLINYFGLNISFCLTLILLASDVVIAVILSKKSIYFIS